MIQALKTGRSWNAGRTIGAKRALKPQQVWAIRFWLDREQRLRDRAMSIWQSTASYEDVTSSR